MRLLLVIVGGKAYWMRKEAEGWSEPFVETAGQFDETGMGTSRCSWLSATEVEVDVLLDSEHRDVELHWLASDVSVWASWLDRRALRARLSSDQPTADIHRLMLPGGRSALSAHQWELPEELQAWLISMPGILITSLRSIADPIVAGMNASTGSCLYLLCQESVCRHLFYHAGALCVSRSLVLADESSIADSLSDTLAHLSSIGFDTADVRLCTLGVPSDLQRELMERQPLRDQICLDPAFFGDEPIDLVGWIAGLVSETKPAWSRISACIGWPMMALRRSPSHAADNAVATLTRPWAARQAWRGRLCLTSLSIVVLLVSTGWTGMAGIEHWQRLQSTRIEIEGVQKRSEQLRAEAHAIHQQPVAAVASLQLRQRFEWLRQVDNAYVPRFVAQALALNDPVRLESLHWWAVENDPSESAAASLAVVYPDEQFDTRAHWRQVLPATGASSPMFSVSLTGRSIGERSLRAHQDDYRAFVQALEGFPEVSAVHAVRTPVDAYAGGELQASALPASALEDAAEFSLRLYVTASVGPPEDDDHGLGGVEP